MSRLVRNKNEENRPSSSGGDSVTVKNTLLSTNVRYLLSNLEKAKLVINDSCVKCK